MLTVVLLKSNINATTHARSCIYLGWMDNNNNNNNSHDNVYGAVIMTKVIARVHPVHLMSLTCSRLYHISVTVPQDNDQMNGWPYLSDTQLPIVPVPLITVHQLCMLDTEHIVSTVKCKFNSTKC